MSPQLSVIIIAYKRKNYIKEALESVINQTNEYLPVEIILIKNFRDENIHGLSKNLKVIEATDDDYSLGSKVVRAAELAEGEYLSFLEDDDIFLKDKIQFILQEFARDKEVVFIHNNQIYFQEDKKNLVQNGSKENIENSTSILFNINTFKCTDYFKLKPDFNLSSISIKKEIILRHREKIIGKTYLVDTLLFVLSIISGGSLLITNKIYTGYRIHKSNLSLKQNYLNNDQISNYLNYLQNVVECGMEILNYSRETRIESLTSNNYYSSRVMRNLIGGGSRVNAFQNLFNLMRRFEICYFINRFDVFFYSAVSLLSPMMGKYVYKLIHYYKN